jgi:hypothetical protein
MTKKRKRVTAALLTTGIAALSIGMISLAQAKKVNPTIDSKASLTFDTVDYDYFKVIRLAASSSNRCVVNFNISRDGKVVSEYTLIPGQVMEFDGGPIHPSEMYHE